MSKGGFGRGRRATYGQAMIGKSLSLPPQWWDDLAAKAEVESQMSGEKKPISASDILREIIAPVMKGGIIEARVQLEGFVMNRDSQDVRGFTEKGRAPVLAVPFIEVVDGADYYALTVIGDALTTNEENGTSIPDRYYLIMKRETRGYDGALVHVEWKGEDGKPVSVLRRFMPHLDGGATFVSIRKGQSDIMRERGKYQIVGVVSRAWDGSAEG